MAVRARVELSADVDPAVRSVQRAVNQINKITGGISKNQVNFNVNGKSFTQPLGRITSSANEFTKSLEASNARVIAFGASVGIINGITDSFKYLVAETIRFEKTLKDINVVLNVSNQQLQQFGQGLFDVARNTAQGFNIAAEAALEFSRQGLSTEEVLKRTNDALTLTRITSLDATEAVAGLTAAVNAFGKAGLTTTEIIDKLAAVDVKFAVSSEDLINGLERAGAVAIDAGVSLDSLIGIITSLQQTTARGGAVIGNGLKTIFTRIQRPESIRQLEKMDIAVRDLTGSILPADMILKNIATSFKNLSQAQQSNVVQFSAGIFQANIFRAALTDLAKAQGIQERALGISANAAGEAARKNELLNKSLSALASQAGTGMKELAGIMGELAFKEDIGGWLELFGKSIEGLKNSLGGGEDEGSTFAKGLVRGIGNVLTGPGMVAFVVIFGKLLTNVFKFASTSLKDVMGIVSEKEKIKKIEESILKVLGSNKDITEALNELSEDRTAQEKFILGIIERQTNALAEQEKLARRLAPGMKKAGIGEDLSFEGHKPTILVDLDGDGHKDKFGAGGLNPESIRKEKQGAAKGGYTAGPIAKMNVPGIGGVVYNKAETVKQFPGMKQPAIMPPEQSRAGENYKRAFGSRHGFDPYASGGFVPNFVLQSTWGANDPRYKGSQFAKQNGTMLVLPPAKLRTETAHTDPNTGKKMVGWQILESPYKNIDNIKTIRDAGLDDAFSKLNVTALTRAMFFADKDPSHSGGAGRVAAKAANKARSAAMKGPRRIKNMASSIQGSVYEGTLYDKVLKADDYIETWEGEYNKKSGYVKGAGDKDANVDFFKMGHIPFEAKAGKFENGNLIGKSINLAADSYIEDFLRSKGYGDMADTMMAIKRTKSIKLLESLGKTADDLDASGLSGGLVPNFSIPKSTPRELIADLLKSTWDNKGLVLTNKEIEASTGIEYEENKSGAYKRAWNKDFAFSRGSKITSAGYKFSAKPMSGVGDYTKTAQKRIDDFILQFEDPYHPNHLKFTDADLKNEFTKSPYPISATGASILSASGHAFSAIESDPSRNLLRDIEVYRRRVLQPMSKSSYPGSGAAKSLPFSGLQILSKNRSLSLKAKGSQIGAIFPGITSGASQSFLGLTTPGALTKKEKPLFDSSTYTSTAKEYGFADKSGRFLSYNELIDAPYKLNASGFEDAIVDISSHQKGFTPYMGASIDGAPLDFINKRLGEAKFGPTAYRDASDAHLTGKLLRYLIGSGSFSWPPTSSGPVNLGSFDFLNTDIKGVLPSSSFIGPPEPPSKRDSPQNVRNRQAHRNKKYASKGLIPNFLSWRDRPGGGSKIPVADNRTFFSKEEVEEIKAMGYKRTDRHGWHYAEPVGLKHTPLTKVSPFGLAEPMSFDFLSKMIQHDREIYSIPNRDKGNPDLDTLGRSLIAEGQRDPVQVGYDSTVNRMQLIEGNHRLAAIARLNDKRDKTQKFYSGIHGYVSGIKLRNPRDRDIEAGLVNQQTYPPKIPDSIKEAMKDPYRPEGQFIEGTWSPSEFGIPSMFRGLVPNFAFRNTAIRLDGGFAGGFIPNYSYADALGLFDEDEHEYLFEGRERLEGMGKKSDIFDNQSYDKRSLDIGYLSSAGSSGPQIFKNLLKQIVGAAEEGNPYAKINAGQITGPRIPTVILKTKRILDRQRAAGKKIPFMNMIGTMDPPARLLKQLEKNKSKAKSSSKYVKGEEKELLQSFKELGLNPESYEMRDLDTIPMLKNFDKGFIPNFAKVRWSIGKDQLGKKTYAIAGSDYDLRNFGMFLKEKGINPQAIAKYKKRLEEMQAGVSEQYKKAQEAEIGTGRTGAKYYRGFDSVGAQEEISTEGLFIKGLGDLIKEFNRNSLFASGFIPNFSNPLSDAINRERSAGLAKSQIRVAQDDELKGPRNPMGLGVINTRDEPLGIKQGIRRARERGIDPKTHGASEGIIPNFASDGGNLDADFFKKLQSSLNLFIESGKEGLSELKDDFKEAFSSQTTARWGAFFDSVEKVDPNNLTHLAKGLDSLDDALLTTKTSINNLEKKDTRTADEEKQLQVLKKTDARLATTHEKFTQAKKAGDMAADTKTDSDLKDNIDDITETYNKLLQALEKKFAGESDKGKRAKIEEQHNDLVEEKNKAMIKEKEITELSAEAKQGDLQKLFFMSSMIQMVNGQFQELANSTNNVVSNLAKFGEGLGNVVQAQITAKEFGGQLMESVGVDAKSGVGLQNIVDGSLASRNANFKASEMERARKAGPLRGLGKIFGPITKLGRYFTRFVPIVGQLYTGFTILNEAFKLFNDGEGIMSLFDSGADKARKKIEKLGKASEATAAALESIKKLEDTKVKLAELEIKGNDRTIKQEGEYLKLQLETLKLEQKQAESINDLTDKNKTGEMGAKLLSEAMKGTTGSLAEQKKALEEVTLRLQAMSAVASINVGFGENMDAAESEDSAMALSRLHGQSFAALSANKFGDDPEQVQEIANYLTKMLDTGLEKQPGRMDATYDFYDAINNISTSRLKSLGMDKDNAQILKDELRLMYDAVQMESDSDIDEDKVMSEGIKSFINTMTKGMDVSGAMRKLVESTGNARKELERRIVIGKALRSMEQKELDTKDALIKLSNKRAEFENNLLKEAGGLSRSEAVIRDTKLKMLDLEMDQSKKRRDAESKLTEALLDQAQKTLRVENLTKMNEADLNTALANLTKNYQDAADKLKDPKILHQINRGMPGAGIEAGQKDINKAESILNYLAEVAQTGNAGELQSVLNKTFLELENSQNNMVNVLVQSALAMSKGLPLTEENFKIMRASLIERKKTLHGLKEDRKIKELEIKDAAEQKAITDRTLQGARDRKKILDQQLITEKSILDNLMGEAANQKVQNDYSSREASLRKKSIAYRAMIFEKLRGEVQGNILSEQDESEKLDQTVMLKKLRRDPGAVVRNSGIRGAVNKQTELDALKVKSELTNLQNSRLEAQDRNSFIAIWNQRVFIAKETFLAEQASQENEILNNAALEKHLSIRENRLDAAKRTLILEVQGIEKESQLLNSKIELLKDANYRAYISKAQVDSELKQLTYDNEIEKAKFEYALHTGKLKETAKETAKAEVLALEKDAMLLTFKNKELQNNKELLKRQQRALSLQDMQNKLQEMRNAQIAASVDQGVLGATVGADMQIEMANQRLGTRTAATRAQLSGKPEDMLAFTEQLKEYNITVGNGTRAIDQLRVKMAEMSVSASNLGSDLVDIGIEGARSGMVELFKSIGSGAEDASEAWKKFSLGIAENLLDRIMQHNVDKIINDLSYAFTGVDPANEANKFLIENNSELSLNTAAIEAQTKVLSDGIRSDTAKPVGSPEEILARIERMIAALQAKHAALYGSGSPKGKTEEDPMPFLGGMGMAAQDLVPKLEGLMQYPADIIKSAKPRMEQSANDLINAVTRSLASVTDEINRTTSGPVAASPVAASPVAALAKGSMPPDRTPRPSGQLELEYAKRTALEYEIAAEIVKMRNSGDKDQIEALANLKKNPNQLYGQWKDRRRGKSKQHGGFVREVRDSAIGKTDPDSARILGLDTPHGGEHQGYASEGEFATPATGALRRKVFLEQLAKIEIPEQHLGDQKAEIEERIKKLEKTKKSGKRRDSQVKGMFSDIYTGANEGKFLGKRLGSDGRIRSDHDTIYDVSTPEGKRAAKTHLEAVVREQEDFFKKLEEQLKREREALSALNAKIEGFNEEGEHYSKSKESSRQEARIIFSSTDFGAPMSTEEEEKINRLNKVGVSHNLKWQPGPSPEAQPILAEINELKQLIESQEFKITEKSEQRSQIEERLKRVTELYAKHFPQDLEKAVGAVKNTLAEFDKRVTTSKDILNALNAQFEELNKKLAAIPVTPPQAPSTPLPALSTPPPAKENFWGGRIQKFAEGGFVTGPAGRDQVPAMLTAGEYVVPKDEVQKFAPGGRAQAGSTGNWWEEGMFGWNRSNSDHRGTAAMQGFMRMAAMNQVSDLMRDSSGRHQDKPPEFDMKKLNQLNLKSDVSMKRGDRRLSAKALAKDPVMQEYKNYLMDKSAYNVQKTNERYQEKLQRKMAYVQLGQGMIMSAAMDKFVSPVVRKAGDLVRAKGKKAGNFFGEKFGKYRKEYSHARNMANSQGRELNYSDFKSSYKDHLNQTGHGGFYQDQGNLYYATKDGIYNMSDKSHIQALNNQAKLAVLGAHSTGMPMTSAMKNFTLANAESTYKLMTKRNRGGSIPSMLTAGEGFIPAPIAKRIGYGNLDVMNKTGSLPTVKGPGGIDKVGPVGLSEGDFIIRKSSTDKLMRENPNMMRFALQNPDGFRRGETGYYEGGIVGTGDVTSKSIPSSSGSTAGQPVNRIQPLIEAAEAQQKEKVTHSQNNEVTNNINVNVTIDSSGNETVEAESTQTSYEQEQELAMKIKSKVIEVIREEKRLGGELDR